MAIGHMMHELADTPAAVTVPGIKLSITEALNCRAEVLGQRSNRRDSFLQILWRDMLGSDEIADRISKRVEGWVRRESLAHAPDDTTFPGCAFSLGVMGDGVVMMMAAMMCMGLRKHRRREQQEQRENKQLLHSHEPINSSPLDFAHKRAVFPRCTSGDTPFTVASHGAYSGTRGVVARNCHEAFSRYEKACRAKAGHATLVCSRIIFIPGSSKLRCP